MAEVIEYGYLEKYEAKWYFFTQGDVIEKAIRFLFREQVHVLPAHHQPHTLQQLAGVAFRNAWLGTPEYKELPVNVQCWIRKDRPLWSNETEPSRSGEILLEKLKIGRASYKNFADNSTRRMIADHYKKTFQKGIWVNHHPVWPTFGRRQMYFLNSSFGELLHGCEDVKRVVLVEPFGFHFTTIPKELTMKEFLEKSTLEDDGNASFTAGTKPASKHGWNSSAGRVTALPKPGGKVYKQQNAEERERREREFIVSGGRYTVDVVCQIALEHSYCKRRVVELEKAASKTVVVKRISNVRHPLASKKKRSNFVV